MTSRLCSAARYQPMFHAAMHSMVLRLGTALLSTLTVRHADAEHLWITVSRDGDTVAVTADDDGRGTANVRPGNGLTGMRERLEHVGGMVTYSSAPDRGFRLEARLPVS